jgi:transcriptional regulator
MQMSEDVLRVEEGSLYPALYRIERQGWITAEWGVSENNLRAKFYKLTRASRKQLHIEEENWERLAGAVFKVMQTN